MTRKLVQFAKHAYADPEPIDEPTCLLDEDDPASAFQAFMLSRIKNSRDEASEEILKSMEAGRSLGDAIADAIESLPSQKTRKLRVWVDQAQSSRVYAYVKFFESGTYVGLRLTQGGPTDELIAEEEIDVLGPRTNLWEWGSFVEAKALHEAELILLDPYRTKREKMLLQRACTNLRSEARRRSAW